MNRNNYCSIHNHTEFSNIKIIDSINRSSQLIDYAWNLGLSGLAITEHDCLSGVIKVIENYRKKLDTEWEAAYPESENVHDYEQMSNDLSFKVIIGNEIYLSEEGLDESQMDGMHPAHFWHLILLAKDEEGFKQLKRLSSAAWKRAWFRGILRTPTYPSDLFEYVQGGHLICSTACLGGYPAWCWKEWVETQNEEYLIKLDNHLNGMNSLFGDGNFYIELQPNEDGSEQNEYNKFMIKHYWGKYPFIFSTDSHYLKADDREVHKAFLNSKTSKDREVDSFYKYAYMMSQDEVYSLMSDYVNIDMFNEMVANTQKIAAACHYFAFEQPQVIAKVEYEHLEEYKEDLDVFGEVDEETYPNLYYYLHTDETSDRYLMELIAHGYIDKYQPTWKDDIYYARLEEELWTLKVVGESIHQHMSDYFITMAKMVDLMWEAGSLVGPSRGSAGALLINYLIGITQMNPVELDLPFVWRFMHPSRPDMPDIDVDSESDKRAAVFNAVRDYFRQFGGDVINVCTFGTEGTKSALKTAGRGLGISDEVIVYLTSMIPNERGFDWSLNDCYYGNGEDRQPIKAFKEQMNEYPRLWELAQTIEGLVTRLGVHASGVVCVNGDFIEHGSYMKTNKEQLVTAFDLHDQEKCALIKYDMLTVSALDRIHQCMNYMLEDGTMEWQGTLRKTYDKYLSPSVIDYDTEEMWRMASDGEISSLFQFDTIVGGQSIKKIQPRSLKQLAISNSIMRLMSDGEQPIDIYVKQKRVPDLWYDDMYACGLTTDEMKVMEKYLKEKSGVAESQEVVMQLSMDPQISGFSMKDANKLRKIIAKKKFSEINQMHDYYMECGHKLGTSDNLLNYVWDKQFKLSFGYSFSSLHTTGYSIIAVQEMNLAYHYPIIYWNTACLSVDASAINAQDFYSLVDDDIIDTDEVEGKRAQNKMDYAKLASALDRFKRICNIHLPNINTSRLSFTPDVKTNSILYGLKGITRITQPVIEEIMMNRPYVSLEDFMRRTTGRIVTKDKIINLIKCGAFDDIEKKSRREILNDYIWMICQPKTKLTLQNANQLIEENMFPSELNYNCQVYLLTKELRKNRDDKRIWYMIDRLDIPENNIELWKQIFKDAKKEVKELVINDEPRYAISSDSWDIFYDSQMELLRKYIKGHQEELIVNLNQRLFDNEWNKYCSGDEYQWELDALNFYFSGHPLTEFYKKPPLSLELSAIDDIIEGAIDGSFFINGKQIPKMRLYTLAGTVIDRDTTKGMVTLQCPDGVVILKVYKNLFAAYNKSETAIDSNGNEIVVEESFFEKGTHLLVTGILRGTTFIPKVYKNVGRHSMVKINLDKENHFIGFQSKTEE